MTNDNQAEEADDFINKIKSMNTEELGILHAAYLSFSSKFIEYVREVDPVTFKRALDYAATVSNPQTTEN